jgi:hypothetical protein
MLRSIKPLNEHEELLVGKTKPHRRNFTSHDGNETRTRWTLMSTPDALPTEIALIALLLSKFQAYSTSLRHYYHRPIILSVNYTPHGIDQRLAITSREVLLSIGLAPYTRTVQPHTASVTWSSIAVYSLNFYQFPRVHFHFNCMHQESWDPLTAVLRPSSIIMKQPSE